MNVRSLIASDVNAIAVQTLTEFLNHHHETTFSSQNQDEYFAGECQPSLIELLDLNREDDRERRELACEF